jgi:hypothetical protein
MRVLLNELRKLGQQSFANGRHNEDPSAEMKVLPREMDLGNEPLSTYVVEYRYRFMTPCPYSWPNA